jgi:hypothetical protein
VILQMDEALKNYIIGGAIAVVMMVIAFLVFTQINGSSQGDHLVGNAIVDQYTQVPIYDKYDTIVGYVVMDTRYTSKYGGVSIETGVNGYTTGTTSIETGVNGKVAIETGVNGYNSIETGVNG